MPRHRIYEPSVPENRALSIIGCRKCHGDLYFLLAGHLNAMLAAWDAIADYLPRDRLFFQFGSPVLQIRDPELARTERA